MWKLPCGKVIKFPQPVVIDGIQHSSAIFEFWTPTQLKDIGISTFKEVWFDQEHFVSKGFTDTIHSNGTVEREHTLEPRHTVEEKKAELLADAKYAAQIALEETDWYVIREMETRKPIPIAIRQEREAHRATLDAEEEAIAELQTHADAIAFNKKGKVKKK